jgi:hypothetical protein
MIVMFSKYVISVRGGHFHGLAGARKALQCHCLHILLFFNERNETSFSASQRNIGNLDML